MGKDERDFGLRNILNFGHTIGHAIEALPTNKWSGGSTTYHNVHECCIQCGKMVMDVIFNVVQLLWMNHVVYSCLSDGCL